MQVDQFGTVTYDLTESGWPFQDKIVVLGNELTGMCGPLVVNFFITGTTDVVSFITFDQVTGLMTIAPGLDDPYGNLKITMSIQLANYMDVITVPVNFDLFVIGTNNCAFDVISFQQTFDDEEYKFSQPMNYLTFDPMVK